MFKADIWKSVKVEILFLVFLFLLGFSNYQKSKFVFYP